MGLILEEPDQLLAQLVVVRVLEHRSLGRAGGGTGPRGSPPTFAAGPLVIITTRSERNSASSTSCVTISAVFWSSRPELEQHLLQLEPRERVEHAERLVEQEHLRVESAKARAMPDALPHAAATARRGACAARRRGRRSVEVVRGDLGALGAGRRRMTWSTPSSDVVERGHPGEQARRLEDDAAIGAGPATSRPARTMPPAGRVGAGPATIDSTVDLPQPEWPMRQTNSPFGDGEVEVLDDDAPVAVRRRERLASSCESSRYFGS